MLKGRESLRRLIGKRRRSFSSPLARRILSKDDFDPTDATPFNSKELETVDNGGSEACVEWVSCPVCAALVPGDDFTVNCHLDTCLASGKKRKLIQRTLFQVNFLSKSRQETCMIEENNHNVDKCDKELYEEKRLRNFYPYDDFMLRGSCGTRESVESLNHPYVYNLESSSQTSILVDEGAAESKSVDSHFPSTSPSIIQLPRSDSREDNDTKHVYTIETLIVGRRFHEKIELKIGGRVYVQRESQNVKDDNAIKVLCDYQGYKCSLGYLPCQLAKHLSPLIDSHHLNCEGSILSLPEHALDAVPIILFCHKVLQDGDVISCYQQDFESLWEKVIFANESAKLQPIGLTKYQQNFRLMLEDVLDNHSHLFTSEEKCLIGYFSSLSDDAQRLFVRLYTRKGPWFRLSNISYKEISDLAAGINELQTTGYLCSLCSGVQSFKYTMKEVLDVLTVSELQLISNQGLSKNVVRHGRKQEIVEYILSASKNGECPRLQKMVLEFVGNCVMIPAAVDAILWRIQRLFFLNGEQDLSAFLLVDLGLIKFSKYTCTVTRQIFKCRSDLLEYEEAIEVAQIMDESIDQSDMEMTSRCIELSDNRLLTDSCEDILYSVSGNKQRFFSYFSASWVYSKVLTLGVSVYEREHRYGDAIRLLRELLKQIICDSRRGYWTLRLSIDLEHLGHFNESLSLAEKGVEDPWIRAGSKMALQRRVLRLGKPPRRWKIPSYADVVMRKITEVIVWISN